MFRLLVIFAVFAGLAARYHQPLDMSSAQSLADSSIKAAPVVAVEGKKEAIKIITESGVPAAKSIAQDLKKDAQLPAPEVHQTQPQPAPQVSQPEQKPRNISPPTASNRCAGYGQPDQLGNLNYCL